jgi:Uma2 family endonuclease
MHKAELINGEIITEMPPKDVHQKLVGLLYLLLVKLIPGGEVRLAPSAVHLDEKNVPEPDLFWVSGPESRGRLGDEGWWHGAPDMVIEDFTPSTAI